VPIYNMVCPDAVVVSYGSLWIARPKEPAARMLGGGVPEIPVVTNTADEKTPGLIRQMLALNKRGALLEMTGHDFLDKNYRKERTVFFGRYTGDCRLGC
jgi:hypothetical protein